MEVNSISLRQALGPVSFVGCGDVSGATFCCDSRKVCTGDVFVALPGQIVDGHQFVESAVASGAAAVVLERPNSKIGVPQCVVPDIREAWAKICMAQYGRPERSLTVAGITGTNGKTTSAWLLRAILETAGKTTGLLGTIEYSDGCSRSPAALTTPPAPRVAEMFAKMAKQHASHCVMEVSSHALDQKRCAAVPFAAGAITNITRDHFDYHGDAFGYRTAKSKIASLLVAGAPLLMGIDDPGCRAVMDLLPATTRTLTFGFDASASLRAEMVSESIHAQHVRLSLDSGTIALRSSLVGRHNVLNILVAASLAEQLGIDLPLIVEAIEAVTHVPGRMERIDVGQPFTVLVDYAHTPDGISHCLATARTLVAGKVILVFGAGGDRDRLKRPLMALAACTADSIIVTSDNPRSEPPVRIIDEICGGFTSMLDVQVCIDRNKAIELALQMAEPGDAVVVAGRGHETSQQIGIRTISFDDRKVARRILRELQASRFPSPQHVSDAIPV